MFSSINYTSIFATLLVFVPKTCTSDLITSMPSLVIYSPGEMEYTDVLVKTVHDNLTLVCELRGDAAQRHYVWNYMAHNESLPQRPFEVEAAKASSRLSKPDLQLSDSGQYMCSAPPFSVTKYIVVQTAGVSMCARGAFRCGARCVLPAYVCDGRSDCAHAQDEHPDMCGERVCERADRLNCSSGRCIPEAACCRTASPLCWQPSCCDQHPRYSRLEGFVDVEYPQLFEDRHAPDDYGFIQSTIYTVTACALIFMVAVVVLVSAVCKLHMKRAALRGYAHADRAARQHYARHYAQTHRFPPCYEASRLVDEPPPGAESPPAGAPDAAPPSAQQSPLHSPTRQTLQCNTECPGSPPAAAEPERSGFSLARLSSIFSSRYRQVPTQPADVEMRTVRAASLSGSPARSQLQNYRSPTYCDLDADFFIDTESPDSARDLNFLTPVDFFCRRPRRNTLERVMDQLDRQRLTLQVGRFQLTLPSFTRDRRPDTPNVGELDINDLDFVRMNSSETYTLNGRTIRLLGADFENYPVMPDGSVRPPPYTEAMRYKLCGPPPEYLSREGLNRDARVDEDARNNIEMPPCYDELASAANNGNSVNNNDAVNNGITVNRNDAVTNGITVNRNDAVSTGITVNSSDTVSNSIGILDGITVNSSYDTSNSAAISDGITVNSNGNEIAPVDNRTAGSCNSNALVDVANGNVINSNAGTNFSTLSAVIDELPAIDCDANANDIAFASNNIV